jgi:hypothetical protein
MRLPTVLSLGVLVLSLSSAFGQAGTDERTIWGCRTANPDAVEPVLYLVEWGEQSYVKVSYMRFAGYFHADADQRAWYWHNDGSGYYRYGLILGSDGKAWYHEFGAADSADSQPLDYFLCTTDE